MCEVVLQGRGGGGDRLKRREQELETEASCGLVLPYTVWQFFANVSYIELFNSSAQAHFYMSSQQK